MRDDQAVRRAHNAGDTYQPAAPGAYDATDQMPALTGIRLPLALWVVAHHLGGADRMLQTWMRSSPVLGAIVESAWVALTAFFAISGFVIARRYRGAVWTRASAARYAAARVGRIYPLYVLSLLILLPIMREALAGDRLGAADARAGLIGNYVLLLQGWHRPAVEWNTPAWSLSCEVFFYAAAPFVLRALGVATWRRAVGAAAVACLVPVVLRLLIVPPIPKALLYFGDFLIGVAAASLYDDLRARGVRLRRIGPWLSGPALAAGVLLVVYRDAIGSFLLFDFGIRVASAALVLGLACSGGAIAAALASPVLVAGGRASYAIYILHVPILWWYRRSTLQAMLPPALSGLAYVALVLVYALAASRWYEPQANALVRRRWARPPALAAGRTVPDSPAGSRLNLTVREDAASHG
jgi:peptidoglycan/LPS O-acetylase OafA/YrhL